MQYKIFNIELHLDRPQRVVIRPKQQETGAKVLISLKNNHTPFDLSDSGFIKGVFKRPDGFLSYIEGTVKDAERGIIEILLTNQILNKPGQAVAEIQITGNLDEDSKQVRSWTFLLDIQPSVGSTELKSVNELTAIETLVQSASQQVIDKINDLHDEARQWLDEGVLAEEERELNEEKRKSNETERQQKESTRQSNESVRESNESVRASSETTRKSNEDLRTSDEEQRKSDELTRKSNESDRVSNESDRISNESTRQSNESDRQENESQRQANESDRQDFIASVEDEWEGLAGKIEELEDDINRPDYSAPETTFDSVTHLDENATNGQISVTTFGETRTNLVPNSDFSDGTMGIFENLGGSTITQEKSFIGNYAIKTTNNVGSNVAFSKPIHLNVGEKYSLSAYYYYTDNIHSENSFRLTFYDENDNYISAGDRAPTPTEKGKWIRRVVPVTQVPEGTAYAKIQTRNWSVGDGVYMDAFLLEKVEDEGEGVNSYINNTKSTISGRVKAVGKNLFDGNGARIDWGNKIFRPDGSIDTISFPRGVTLNYTPIKENTVYSINKTRATSVNSHVFYDKSKNIIGSILTGSESVGFTTPPNAHYMRFTIHPHDFEEFQLEEGDTATDYEPYTSTSRYYPAVPLRSLPSGVKDEISDDGEYIKRVDDGGETELSEPIITELTGLGELQSHPNGTIYKENATRLVKSYDDGIITDLPIDYIESVTKLDDAQRIPIDLDDVSYSDSTEESMVEGYMKSDVSISGAEDGEIYEIVYFFKSEISTSGEMEYSYPINLAGALQSTSKVAFKTAEELSREMARQRAVNLEFDFRINILED